MKLCNAVNHQTLNTILGKITKDFKDEKLNEPNFKVYPQMIKVKDFFKGGYEKFLDKYVGQQTNSSQLKDQIIKEKGLHYEIDANEVITKDELLQSIVRKQELNSNEKRQVTAVVASAGSGKTTLLRRLAEESLNSCPVFCEKTNSSAVKSDLKMVYYVEMKNLKYEDSLKPSKFMFGGFFETETDEDDAYKWLLDHQSEAVIYFDGLDQAAWNMNESNQILRPFEKGSTSDIFYNLLSRNLLPQAKVVIASREFKISELPADSRPEDIITLVGLKLDDAKKLFVHLVGDHGADIWNNITKFDQRLLNLLSIPVFLVLSAAVMARDHGQSPPTTLTDLYNSILFCFCRLETIQERKKILEIIKKLKAMAHQGMVDARVVFNETDLKRFDLPIQDVRDLIIKIPGKNSLSRYLLEGDFLFFFCHKSFQEFLSASFVAEMKSRQFSRFNDHQLHEDRWSVVRSFVSGIIHDESATELHQGSLGGLYLKMSTYMLRPPAMGVFSENLGGPCILHPHKQKQRRLELLSLFRYRRLCCDGFCLQ